jgi:amino acid efflux transporter
MEEKVKLKKSMNWPKGAALTIGSVMGAGILVLPAAAAQLAGPLSLFSWILMGAISIPIVITIGLMSSRYPNSGGMASYTERAFGPFWGRLTGILILSAMPFSMPITALIGANDLGAIFSLSPLSVHILAGSLLVIAVLLNYLGVRFSGRIQILVTTLILLILLSIIIASVPSVRAENFQFDFRGEWLKAGQSMNLLFFAYMGWEMIGHLSEEFKNPQKDIPISLGIGFLLINLVYIFLTFVIIGTGSYRTSNAATAIIALAARCMGNGAGEGIAFLGFILCFCTVLSYIAGFSRLVYAQAREGNFPSIFAELHPKFHTPAVALFSFLPVFILILALNYLCSWNFTSLIQIPSTTFLLVYFLSMLAASKVLSSAGGKACALLGAILSAVVFFFAGIWTLYPILIAGLVLLVKAFKRRESTFH